MVYMLQTDESTSFLSINFTFIHPQSCSFLPHPLHFLLYLFILLIYFIFKPPVILPLRPPLLISYSVLTITVTITIVYMVVCNYGRLT